jgi:uncharacterized membrane protein YvlD (DUF360 family)
MSKKGGLSPAQIRAWLVTALVVFVTLNVLLAVIRPLLPYLVAGLVVLTVGGWLLRGGRHL